MNTKLISRILSLLIWVVALFGLNGTLALARREFASGHICPKIIGIPACYIILACLLLILLSQTQLLKDKYRLYYLGVGLALAIATFGTVGNYLGYLSCPQTDSGTPLCYLSFALFASLLVLRLINSRVSKA